MSDQPPPWKGELNPARLRELLLQDPHNVALRKRYLAQRTAELLEVDRGAVRSHRQAARMIFPAFLWGAFFGVVVWGLSWGVVALGLKPMEGELDLKMRLVGV